ncbi:MAG: hypothetical protein DMG19_18760 [Acidobacteria bacterium]|nr:MAG: hypothetical protein DMG19_18760 [Acidobacteriota bacterium]
MARVKEHNGFCSYPGWLAAPRLVLDEAGRNCGSFPFVLAYHAINNGRHCRSDRHDLVRIGYCGLRTGGGSPN